jgi:hypothetical protein
MKNLKEYIKESILRDLENIDVAKDVKSEIKQFLKDNYDGRFSITLVKGKYIVNSKKNVEIKNKKVTSLTNGMFEFGKVDGDFDCFGCSKLISLEGAPKEVKGNFNCTMCSSIINLIGAPEIVGGNFKCNFCNSLETLEGAPKKVGECFYCTNCISLKSREGEPKDYSL